MTNKKQIQEWLNKGTITHEQAEKMLVDSSKKENESKSNKFISIVSMIGAVLIFVGFAWLIAKNWHQIPDIVKVLILAGSTLIAFISGVMLRERNHDGVGRSLISLGALLYVLSLFLISQIYNLATTAQHYAWLLFFSWTIILLTAYLLNSKENLLITMLIFFPWVILQYIASVIHADPGLSGGPIFSFILIFLSIGALLFGLSSLHKSLNHNFTNLYRFWTVFYFLLIFYIMSFQSFLPKISGYSFEGNSFSAFLIIFILLGFIGFIIGTLFATNKKPTSIKEIAGFIGILAILFFLVLATKVGDGQIGNCNVRSCYDFETNLDCVNAIDPLVCEWKGERCSAPLCRHYYNESECNLANSKLNCNWENDRCREEQLLDDEVSPYQTCREYNNQKESCLDQEFCEWNKRTSINSEGLPTSLWVLWIINNIVFIGFIILVIGYAQRIGSTKIINLALFTFVLEIITRYIGFWFDFSGYFAFSVLAILGGAFLIFGAWLVPKWKRKLISESEHPKGET